jgi:HSP20 family molecular chaperone IbpA
MCRSRSRESKPDSEVKEEDYYDSERHVGSFYRSMPLPTPARG